LFFILSSICAEEELKLTQSAKHITIARNCFIFFEDLVFKETEMRKRRQSDKSLILLLVKVETVGF
jgi:hypothetical protein